MSKLNRRAFLANTLSIAATQSLSWSAWAQRVASNASGPAATLQSVRVDVSIDWDKAISSIPEDMLGLSYESYQLAAPDFFSSANTELIALFRRLSPHGILRLGGNLSEYTVWTPGDPPAVPTVPFQAIGPDPSSGKRIPHVPVSPQAVRNLRDFLDATGWRAIYGLSLALTVPERAADEAKLVAATLGPRLIAFQIGNEPDHYVLNGLRPAGYSFHDYFAEWTKVHSAVLEAVPSAHFAGPDVAEDITWVAQFAKAAPPSVLMLSGHRYAEGPPSDPSVTLDRLLASDPSFIDRLAETAAISRNARIPYVMAETNSCYKAGKEGVSNVFGSALWAVDYFLQLAKSGERGAYFHGGANGWYTPIAGGSGKQFEVRPIYYGLEMCSRLSGSNLVATNVAAGSANVSVYALRNPRRLVVINKEARQAAVHLPAGRYAARIASLTAPSIEAKTGISLATEKGQPAQILSIAAYSAAVFEIA